MKTLAIAYSKSLVAFKNHFAANNRYVDVRFVNFFDRYVKDIAIDNNKVREFAFFDRPKFVRPVETKALNTAPRVAVDRLFQRDGLIGI